MFWPYFVTFQKSWVDDVYVMSSPELSTTGTFKELILFLKKTRQIMQQKSQ